MRVLAIGNRYPPAGGGGYERIFASTVGALQKRGHEVEVLTTREPKEGVTPFIWRELQWWWRDGAFPWPAPWEVVRVERHNARVLRRHLEGVDVVSWWGMGGMSMSLVDQVRRAGVPAIGVVGDEWMLYGPHVDGRRRWTRRTPDLSQAAEWLFISEYLHDRVPASGQVVSPGVDPERFPEAPPRAWEWKLAYVGRIEPRKGVTVAIEALELLPEATLTLDGPNEMALEPRDRVTIAHSEDVAGVYAAADAILFPVTWNEPWGLVPLEAMATGRPVIATGTGGSAEYLRHGENALLVPPGDAAALAAAVKRLAADEPLRELLRAGGLETARRYRQAAFEDRVIAALERAVASHAA